MPKLPVVSGAEAVKAFGRAGWRFDRQWHLGIAGIYSDKENALCPPTPSASPI